MKTTPRDYTTMTAFALNVGMVPYKDRGGNIVQGRYTLKGYEAPVDLSACAEDEKSILRTALQQLSEQSDVAYHQMIERDLAD